MKSIPDYTPRKQKAEFQKFSNKYIASSRKVSVVADGYEPRETKIYGSRVTPGGSGALKTPMKYTGDKMLGITIIHKSCLQPVFSQQEAVEAASMRR